MPILFSFGFVGLFTMGGLTGLFLAALGINVHVHDNLFRGCSLPLHHGRRLGHGIPWRPHFCWPKISSKLYPEGWARLVFKMLNAVRVERQEPGNPIN